MRLILVGGFLGAGKTTLLSEAARRLAQRDHRVGVITNDQAPDLVDTAYLLRIGTEVREVAGSCFCCNFGGLKSAMDSLAAGGADLILAEPVGSCTDLSATIVQPMKSLFPSCRVAPLSVLVDPERVSNVLRSQSSLLHTDASYILRVQLEEAEQIILSKADTVSDSERRALLSYLMEQFPGTRVAAISAVTGEGIDPWLDSALAESLAGEKIAIVDYDRYANGEAVLGWLNAVANLRWTGSLQPDWADFAHRFMTAFHDALQRAQSEVGHIKALIESSTGYVAANLTSLGGEVHVREVGKPARLTASLTVNARVQASPEDLDCAFHEALRIASHSRVAPSVRTIHCLKPGRPMPTYRYESIAG